MILLSTHPLLQVIGFLVVLVPVTLLALYFMFRSRKGKKPESITVTAHYSGGLPQEGDVIHVHSFGDGVVRKVKKVGGGVEITISALEVDMHGDSSIHSEW